MNREATSSSDQHRCELTGELPEVLEQPPGGLDFQNSQGAIVVLGKARRSIRSTKATQRPSKDGARRANADRAAPGADEIHRLQQIVDGSSVATFVIDQNHVVTHWNKACDRLTGMHASEMVGTRSQWRAFYAEERPVMADLILEGAQTNAVECFYPGKFRQSALIDGAYEAEDFFPNFGEAGCWLYFTAAPLFDTQGRIIGAIETLQDVTAQRRAEAALKESEERYRQLSITDNLTGLFNSRHFYDELKTEVARSTRYGHPLSLMIVDVDNFKQLNDTCGHLEGDRILESLAELIRTCLRRGDGAYRLGGDEFAVLLPETELDRARMVAERLRAMFAAFQMKSSVKVTVHCSLSIGVTRFAPGEEFTDFVRRADSGTYQAKRQGRNRVVLVAPPSLIQGESGTTQAARSTEWHPEPCRRQP